MQKAQGFKKRYALSALLAMPIAYGIWQVVHFSPFEESVIHQERVNATTAMYVTKGSAGATTRNVYQYYLVPDATSENDFMKGIGNKYSSFLSTSDDNVEITVGNGAIRLAVRGDIYRFSNTTGYSVIVYLTSLPF